MPTKAKEINEVNKKNIKKEKKESKTTKTVDKKTVSSAKKTTTKKIAKKTVPKKETVKKALSTKSTSKTSKKVEPYAEIVEYYDLPYRYNETIVKILYQTPDTLFVYWDISDKDRENYTKLYGENFFNLTRPVLIIHNDSMNYSFEVPINDFSNSWYLHINDSKCTYRVELGRRPNYYNQDVSPETFKEVEENIKTDYIYVSDSNKIESPNDHVLFSTNENNTVKFKNIKNNTVNSISLYDIVKRLPVMKKTSDIPYINSKLLENIYTGIYENEDISLFEKISNPSSNGNPSSGSMLQNFS